MIDLAKIVMTTFLITVRVQSGRKMSGSVGTTGNSSRMTVSSDFKKFRTLRKLSASAIQICHRICEQHAIMTKFKASDLAEAIGVHALGY